MLLYEREKPPKTGHVYGATEARAHPEPLHNRYEELRVDSWLWPLAAGSCGPSDND